MDFGERAPAWTLTTDPAVSDFARLGYHLFDRPVDPAACARLLAKLHADRGYDLSLFQDEAEFDADPQYRGVNPRPGRNLLERFAGELGFVEQAPHIVSALNALLGPGYRVMDRKVVCGVPDKAIPSWLKARIAGNPVNNLGPYVKPHYRDVTYFNGIDFHQDLIDYKDREADFITLYIYLHAVTRADAPLFLLENSHALGASVFPHDLTREGEETWTYRNGPQGEARCRQMVLTGGAGHTACWHALTLHGTQPDESDDERISLRYLFAPADGVRAGLHAVNEGLNVPLSLTATRVDLDAAGAAQIKANTVNQV
ncbi:MAG TPA: phytanoyl-CoA dioxygenase family protein [Caulobacteraceae bacterium]